MNRFASFLTALSFATAGSSALAVQDDQQIQPQNANPQPVQMSDAQLDSVAAGQLVFIPGGLIDVVVNDVTVEIPVRVLNHSVNNNQISVQVPVAAGIGAGVLGGGAGGGIAGAFGNQERR